MNRREFLTWLSAAGVGVTAWGLRPRGSALAQPLDPTSHRPAPILSNQIVVAGQAVDLGGHLRVANFRDNPALSFPGEPVHRPTDAIQQVILHQDAAPSAFARLGQLYERGLSSHFLIDRDGTIVQALDPLDVAYHAGEFNRASIGIDLNNPEDVDRNPSAARPRHARRCEMAGVINGARVTSHLFAEAQYVALGALLERLGGILGLPLILPLDASGDVIPNRLPDPYSFVGVLGYWHCNACSVEPGPTFNWHWLQDRWAHMDISWPIDLGEPTPVALTSASVVEAATWRFYTQIEDATHAPRYPLGEDERWRDGVAIPCARGTPVHALAQGEIILTRNGPNLPLGSPNFVLMRHWLRRDYVEYDALGNAEITTDQTPWYSMYLHLDRLDPDAADSPATPDWYGRLVALARESKPGPLVQRDDYVLDEARADPGLFLRRARKLLDVADAAIAHESVEDGRPFRWPDPADDGPSDLQVPAGALLGYAGEMGEYADGRVERRPQVRVQVFAANPLFDHTLFGTRTWLTVRERGDRELLAATGTNPPVHDRHRAWRIIGYHPSEWDVAANDARWADRPIVAPWETPGERLLRRGLEVGYEWLNDDACELLGMSPGDSIYTYHPIYLIGFWARHYGATLQRQHFEGLDLGELHDAQADCDGVERTVPPCPPGCPLPGNGEWDPDTAFLSPTRRPPAP